MATKNNKSKRDNIILKVQPQELNLTDLKELLKKSKSKPKRNKVNTGKNIGYIITTLGILALISSLIINRFVDQEYFTDANIIFIMSVSIITLLFGFYILIRETR